MDNIINDMNRHRIAPNSGTENENLVSQGSEHDNERSEYLSILKKLRNIRGVEYPSNKINVHRDDPKEFYSFSNTSHQQDLIYTNNRKYLLTYKQNAELNSLAPIIDTIVY